VSFLLQRLLFEFQQQDTIELGKANGQIEELREEEESQSVLQQHFGEKTLVLLDSVIKHVVDGKIDGCIKAFMLEDKKLVLSKQTLAMINTESKNQMEKFVGNLLQAAFINDEAMWLQSLRVPESEVTDDHLD